MKYQLLPARQEEATLFFRLDGEAAERHGAISGTQIDFGIDHSGSILYRFDCQRHLRTAAFRSDFDRVISYLRGAVEPFGSQQNFKAYCHEHEGQSLKGDEIYVPSAFGVSVRTEDYSYYFRCHPITSRVNIFAYDNRYLLPELAGKHELPEYCYSTMPSSGDVIVVRNGERGCYACQYNEHDAALNREYVHTKNEELGVTRAQEEAMLSGSMFGWNTPAAKPWNYDQNGKPRLPAPKDKVNAKNRDDAR